MFSLSQPQFSKSINPCIKSPTDENAVGELYCWVFQLFQHHFLDIQQRAQEEYFDNVIKCWTIQTLDLQSFIGMSHIHSVSFISQLFGGALIRLTPTVLCGDENPGNNIPLPQLDCWWEGMLFWEQGLVRLLTTVLLDKKKKKYFIKLFL